MKRTVNTTSSNCGSNNLNPGKKMRMTSACMKKTSSTISIQSSNSGKLSNEKGLFMSEANLALLPTETLETIIGYFTFHELCKLREICKRFRDIINIILNDNFYKLQPHVERMLANYEKEIGQSRVAVEYPSEECSKKKIVPSREMLILVRCRGLLTIIISELNILKVVCYRPIFLNSSHSDICYPHCFFAGKILDEIHRILRIVRLKTIKEKDMKLKVFLTLVHKWIDFYHDTVEPLIITSEGNLGCRTTLFGSKVIDFLECVQDSNKHIDAYFDSKGWFYFKGEYTIPSTFFTCISNKHIGHEYVEPLSAREQRNLHDCLRLLAERRNEYLFYEKIIDDENALLPKNNWFFRGLCEGLNQCDETIYFYGHFSKCEHQKTLHPELVNVSHHQYQEEIEGELDLIFEVDMKCRKELAPIDMLLECTRNSSVEDYENSTGNIQREMEDHLDLDMKLEIYCSAAQTQENRLPPLYKCLIQQKYDASNTKCREEDLYINPTNPKVKRRNIINYGKSKW